MGAPVMAGVAMGFPSDMTPASQEDLRVLLNRLMRNEGVTEEIKKWQLSHAGIEATGAGPDYPHPIQRVRSLTFGAQQGLLSNDGIFLRADAARSSFTNLYWLKDIQNERDLANTRGYIAVGLGAGATNDPAEMVIAVESTDPSGQIAKIRMVTSDAGISGGITITYVNTEISMDDTFVYVNHADVAGGTVAFDGDWSEKTIAAGVITITGSRHVVDTQSDAATDDLDTINGGIDGQTLVLCAANSARDVVVTEAGNLKLAGGSFTLDNTEDTIMLVRKGSAWLELCRSNNGV